MNLGTKPTLHSVAERAQVSIASVSRVINGRPATAQTKARVQQAIAELGYQPNSSARALKARTSDQICLILPDLANPVFQSMIRGVQRGFRNSKYRVMLSTSAMTTLELVRQLENLGQSYADGLIINALIYDDEIVELLRKLNIPVVILGSTPKGLNADSIRVDNERGVQIGIDYLYSQNRERIFLLNGPQSTIPAKKRKKGFIDGLAKHGISDPDLHIVNCKAFTAKAAIEALASFKNLRNYDSVICANDLLAAGVLRFLSDKNIKVPEQVSVVGIDNTDLADLLNPAITSIDFKAEYRGELASKFMIERLANPETPLRRMLIEPELIIRKSV